MCLGISEYLAKLVSYTRRNILRSPILILVIEDCKQNRVKSHANPFRVFQESHRAVIVVYLSLESNFLSLGQQFLEDGCFQNYHNGEKTKIIKA